MAYNNTNLLFYSSEDQKSGTVPGLKSRCWSTMFFSPVLLSGGSWGKSVSCSFGLLEGFHSCACMSEIPDFLMAVGQTLFLASGGCPPSLVSGTHHPFSKPAIAG